MTNDKKLTILINSYILFTGLFSEINPIIDENQEVAASFSEYLRDFCFAMITRVKSDDIFYFNFTNNLTLYSFPEISNSEYNKAISTHDFKYYDENVFERKLIIQKILQYDSINRTQLYKEFIVRLCCIAEMFSQYRPENKEIIDEFRNIFISKSKELSISEEGNENQIYEASKAALSAQASENVKPAQLQRQSFSAHPIIDGQYVLRIITPITALAAISVGAIITGELIMLGIAIIPLCFLIAGFKASSKRCPICHSWNSIITVKSDLVDKKKVKVRRNLRSNYFHSSGSSTFGSRQVFVSADECTYDETYRCNVCGNETVGKRRNIDDGIS